MTVIGTRNIHDVDKSRRLTMKVMRDEGPAKHLRPGMTPSRHQRR